MFTKKIRLYTYYKNISNPTPIQILEVGTATPYPSTINVFGFETSDKIVKVIVTLRNLSYDFLDDVDILLVAPNGKNAAIMADVGNGNSVNDITLSLDDMGPLILPRESAPISGTFQPANYRGEFAILPPPAPINQSGGSMLSAFNFINPNGRWSLFVADTDGGDSGSISGGWEFSIPTSNCTP
ncbi:hypothetical protein ACSVDA_24585 [Cytobacillus sp. Hm23]